jgi:hypothetical protein
MSKYETSSASNELVGRTVDIKYQISGEGGDNEDDGARVESEYQEKVEVIKIMERGWRTRVPKRTPSQTNKVVG